MHIGNRRVESMLYEPKPSAKAQLDTHIRLLISDSYRPVDEVSSLEACSSVCDNSHQKSKRR